MGAHRVRHVRSIVIALVAVAALAGTSSAVVAGPAKPTLVGLGDSYASGLGTGDYDAGSGDCKRSPRAYAPLVARGIGATLTFVACSGATTDDVASDQVSALAASTTDVTLTVGGNDVGFVDVISTCAVGSQSACSAAIDGARLLITNVLPDRLDSLYGTIADRAPAATTYVVGYPRLFDGQDCSPVTDFTRKSMRQLNGTANLLDRVIRESARSAGFTYVDPRKSFEGHALCDADPWINNVQFPIEESFHPTAAGQRAFADLVLARR